MKIAFTLASGREVAFEVDTDRDGPACFLLSIRKCGSSLLTNLGLALAEANGVNFVDAPGDLFALNVALPEYNDDPAMTSILRPGNAYGGYRDAPSAFFRHPLFIEGPKVLLVRDPRDALVSLYFSHAYSHRVPDTQTEPGGVAEALLASRKLALESDIDSWVMTKAPAMNATFTGYVPILDFPAITVLRYEDYIFEKAKLISLIAGRFGWQADAQHVEQILSWADVRPVTEDPTAHIRRVTPGDHLEKLRPETVARLDEILRPALDRFGYAVGAN